MMEDSKILDWVLCIALATSIFFLLIGFNYDDTKLDIDNDMMCFPKEEGDFMIGITMYCKYIDEDCYDSFVNWSDGKGLYWNIKDEVEE